MNSKNIKEIFKILIVSALPTFLSYMSNSKIIFEKLISSGILAESIDVEIIQDYCLWISIALSATFLSLNLIITKIRHNNILEERNLLLKMNKTVLASSLGKKFLSDTSSFDIRIFVPKNPILYLIADKLKIKNLKKKFIIKNIDQISEQGITKNLQFEVFPNDEGLVGMCYQKKAIVYDDDLVNNNDKNYKLSPTQLNRTSNLKWSICCPICNEESSVVAIIALDGKTENKINKEKSRALNEELLAFSCMLYDSVPQLFKRR